MIAQPSIIIRHDDSDMGCVNDGNPDNPCQGTVEPRLAPSGSAITRCEHHADQRWEQYENSELERYADSDVAPAWFDPTAAGERWEDDY